MKGLKSKIAVLLVSPTVALALGVSPAAAATDGGLAHCWQTLGPGEIDGYAYLDKSSTGSSVQPDDVWIRNFTGRRFTWTQVTWGDSTGAKSYYSPDSTTDAGGTSPHVVISWEWLRYSQEPWLIFQGYTASTATSGRVAYKFTCWIRPN